MIEQIASAFTHMLLLIITDSWFGNDGLFKLLRQQIGAHCHLLSRLRVNAMLFGSIAKSNGLRITLPTWICLSNRSLSTMAQDGKSKLASRR